MLGLFAREGVVSEDAIILASGIADLRYKEEVAILRSKASSDEEKANVEHVVSQAQKMIYSEQVTSMKKILIKDDPSELRYSRIGTHWGVAMNEISSPDPFKQKSKAALKIAKAYVEAYIDALKAASPGLDKHIK